MSDSTEEQVHAQELKSTLLDSNESRISTLLEENKTLQQSVAKLTSDLEELQRAHEDLRIRKSLEDEDLKSAALSTEQLCEDKIREAESATESVKKQLLEKQAELTTVHAVVKKMVDQFNILIEGMETAQKNGAFKMMEAYKYWTAILAVKSIFKE